MSIERMMIVNETELSVEGFRLMCCCSALIYLVSTKTSFQTRHFSASFEKRKLKRPNSTIMMLTVFDQIWSKACAANPLKHNYNILDYLNVYPPFDAYARFFQRNNGFTWVPLCSCRIASILYRYVVYLRRVRNLMCSSDVWDNWDC
jgi:hypothetical protein